MEWIILFFMLISALAVSVYANINMIKKTESLEDAVEALHTQNDAYENFIQTFSDNLTLIDKQLKEIDSKGTFEADDEVGYTFKTIRLIMSQLQGFNVNNNAT